MAKARVVITDTYETVASGPCTITIVKDGKGAIYFDATGDDATAYITSTATSLDQFIQDTSEPTKCKASGDGWEIVVDGEL